MWYLRGHEIFFVERKAFYKDTGSPVSGNERSCKRCGCYPTKEGFDACIGHVPDHRSACCGHGIEDPSFVKDDAPLFD